MINENCKLISTETTVILKLHKYNIKGKLIESPKDTVLKVSIRDEYDDSAIYEKLGKRQVGFNYINFQTSKEEADLIRNSNKNAWKKICDELNSLPNNYTSNKEKIVNIIEDILTDKKDREFFGLP